MFDPTKSAKAAGLKYVTDDTPGILRKAHGKSFTYIDSTTNKTPSKKDMERIKALVIPPAWKNVWICKDPDGHLQVTGRDARNRKQYRYHEKWTTQRNTTKFDSLKLLCTKLPGLRKKIEHDLKLPDLPREKVLAAVLKTMLITRTRVGNAEYAAENETYGLTTILNDHAKVKGKSIKLNFKGKSGVAHDIAFDDEAISKIIKRCQDLPGEELFAFIEDDHVTDINSQHVNEYLREATGEDFTAKDLRTWCGTCEALKLLMKDIPSEKLSENKLKKRHVSIIKETAASLRNTVAVCKKYYIHPVVLEADANLTLEKLGKSCTGHSKYFQKVEKVLESLLKKIK
ncbi:MAG: DNA topoisomerase IB [Rhizobacter sp.]|nr:DNA topoisomerase IB [Bacteriovorax sp.]